MSAILGIFHLDGRPATVDCVSPMLARMQRRGTEVRALHVEGEALLGVSRYEWECVPRLAGAAAVARRGHLTAVADASLYYLNDLVRRLGSAADGVDRDRPAELILAAYEKWGERCVEYLEGDYACIVWDAKERRGWCTRDWTGSRPLFYARRENTVVVASTIGGVLAHPVVRDELNLVSIAIDASALVFSEGHETCYSDVHVAPAGTTLRFGPDAGGVQNRVWWTPECRPQSDAAPIGRAAEELRSLIGGAVVERMGPSGATAVWLSGGRDSTAVFAAGQRALEARQSSDSLRPVSLGLSDDDPQNESHFIRAVAARWKREIRWVGVDSLGAFLPLSRWEERDAPARHLYEGLFHSLASASRDEGSSVALSGHGGDFLFHVSPVLLADYLRMARMIALAREWRALGVKRHHLREFVHWAVAPLLPQLAHRAVTAIRGRRLHGYFERPIPAWASCRFVREHELERTARLGSPCAERGSRAAFELQWFVTTPHFSQTLARCAEAGLESGVECRAPLLDTRVVRFAAARPVEERRSRGETKLLLRRAMKGLLPADVLAPRAYKTGTLATYFAQSMRTLHTPMRDAFRRPMLAELGIADGTTLRATAAHYCERGGTAHVGEQLLSALQAELWLRSRRGHPYRHVQELGQRAVVTTGA